MPTRSQRPLVARLLALEPVRVAGNTYTSLDQALFMMGDLYTAEDLFDALRAMDVDVDISTLYRWRREVVIDDSKRLL